MVARSSLAGLFQLMVLPEVSPVMANRRLLRTLWVSCGAKQGYLYLCQLQLAVLRSESDGNSAYG